MEGENFCSSSPWAGDAESSMAYEEILRCASVGKSEDPGFVSAIRGHFSSSLPCLGLHFKNRDYGTCHYCLCGGMF